MIKAQTRTSLSLVPIFVSILTYVFVYDIVFIWMNNKLEFINAFSAAMAIGSISMGLLSDIFSRRLTLLILHVVGLIALILYYYNPTSYFYIFVLGIVYNPLPIVRANLIDNLGERSKIKLISVSFIIQFIPEAFYFLYLKISPFTSLIAACSAISISLLVGLLFFFDKGDKLIKEEKNFFSKMFFFLPKADFRAIFTFIAFIPTQLAYFISDNILNIYTLTPLYYSLLSFGSLVGACTSILYKKTPHVSVLTISYGLSLAISALPVGAIFIYNFPHLDIPFMFIALGSLLGFYVPFVYDVILNSAEKRFRGISCGILDFVYSGSSLITLIMFKGLMSNIPFSLFLIAMAFAIALGFQRAAEETSH